MKPGEKLALARRYHAPALTQKDLALQLGVDTSSVGRWEATNRIPKDRLEALSRILDVRQEWFSDGGDTLPTEARRSEPSNIEAIAPHELRRAGNLMVSGMKVAIPVWKGVLAGSAEEDFFEEAGDAEMREVPMYLTLGHPERHVLCIARGISMAPRIDYANQVLIRLDPDVPPGHLVVARSPDNKNYVKKLVRGPKGLELHSINEQFKPILDLAGWILKGGVTAIMKPYEPGMPNLEWDEGRFLRG